MAKGHHPVKSATTGAVFIDARVADLQSLIDGAKAGERVFVIDPTQDGLAQIAADLASAGLSRLSTISIVAHGTAGSLELGSTSLDDDDLAQHATALAAIAAALKPKGQIDLYACDVAAGAAGRRFIADLSHLAGGAHVAAATHTIGKTATGEDWTLDASAGAKAAPTSTPFTKATTDDYQASLATGPTGQLYGLGLATSSTDGSMVFGSFYINSNSTTPVIYNKTYPASNALALDPVLGIDFQIQNVTANGKSYNVLETSNINTQAAPVVAQSFLTEDENINANGVSTNVARSVAVDPSAHIVYVPVGSTITADNGLLMATYSTDANGNVTVGTPTFLETSTGNQAPSYFENGAAYYNNNVYVDDVDDSSSAAENGIYRIPTNGTTHTPVSILNNSGLGRIGRGVVIDQGADRLYFSAGGMLYAVNGVDTANAATPVTLKNADGTTPTFGDIQGLAYDENAHVIYVSNNNTSSYGSSEIDEVQLGTQVVNGKTVATTTIQSITPIPVNSFIPNTSTNSTPTTTTSEPFFGLVDTPLSTLTVTGTAAAAVKGTPLTLLSAATITDITSGGYLKSATVSITDNGNAVSNDVLGFNEGGTFTTVSTNASSPTTLTDNGHTFLASYSSGVLTITNKDSSSAYENTIAAYQQVLQDVQYENNSTDTHARTVTIQVNNGAIGSPSGPTNTKSFTVALAQPPVIVSGGIYNVPGYVVAGASASATAAGPASAPTAGALAGDSDPNGTGLTITAVSNYLGASGTVGSPDAGQFGSLTLSSNGTYTYAASNAAAIAGVGKTHPVDSYTFTVTNAGGSATETFRATIDRAPNVVGYTSTVTQGTMQTGTATQFFGNETDPDGDTSFTVASVNSSAANLGKPIVGMYGTLTLNANGSYSYTALPSVTASSTAPLKDDFTYTATDAGGATSQSQTLEFDVTCFASGTRIRVVRDATVLDVAVEHLAVGDLAVTAAGAARPIRWIGHRTMDLRRHPRPHEAQPIRIAAHAFAPNRPARDIFVSPAHAICVDVLGEVLIPAVSLVNGATIAQVAAERVTYWHVELDDHDILMAENLPAESYIDMGNRRFFDDAAVVDLAAGPDGHPAQRTPMDFCRPFHQDGRLVEVVRERLRARARACGWRLADTGLAEAHLVADGVRLAAVVDGQSVRFSVPAGTRELWLVAPASVPREIGVSERDVRALGLCLAGLAIVADGARRTIALDDPRLDDGFHEPEPGHRWTQGRARLPSSLWAGLSEGFVLELGLAAAPLPRWIAPCDAPEQKAA